MSPIVSSFKGQNAKKRNIHVGRHTPIAMNTPGITVDKPKMHTITPTTKAKITAKTPAQHSIKPLFDVQKILDGGKSDDSAPEK